MIAENPHSVLIEKNADQASDVTVCISLYNYEQHIVETLESVKAQTLAQLDLMVVDDRSTDNSLVVTGMWLQENADRFNQVKLIRHRENRGLARARNTTILLAETPFLFILDADNLLYPRCTERCLGALLSDPNAAMAYPLIEKFGEEEEVIGNVVWERSQFLRENHIDAMSLIRRSALLQVDGYSYLDAIGPLGLEDYDLWCKFIDAGLYGIPVAEILARYR
ncbi:MAG: glycosyltransferase family 2 protein, partial [Merismopedia sp. SIO2A8]|nr:glycosyltransferase family 2 protein [Merismopedia sp. SIO2A8]